jgi:hypothetical protein
MKVYGLIHVLCRFDPSLEIKTIQPDQKIMDIGYKSDIYDFINADKPILVIYLNDETKKQG